MKSIFTLVVLALAIDIGSPRSLGQSGNGEQAESKHARFPASRTTLQGDVWLSWQFPVREWFVEAALAGYKAGYDEGCTDATSKSKSSQVRDQKNPDETCPNSDRFRNEAIPYSKQMTDFYNRYPEDRDLPLAYLVQMLIGPKPKTLAQVHQWVSSIGK